MSVGAADLLLLGYGNPGRLDDGLGLALAAQVEPSRCSASPCRRTTISVWRTPSGAVTTRRSSLTRRRRGRAAPSQGSSRLPLGAARDALQPEAVRFRAQQLFGARRYGQTWASVGTSSTSTVVPDRSGAAELAAAVVFISEIGGRAASATKVGRAMKDGKRWPLCHNDNDALFVVRTTGGGAGLRHGRGLSAEEGREDRQGAEPRLRSRRSDDGGGGSGASFKGLKAWATRFPCLQ